MEHGGCRDRRCTAQWHCPGTHACGSRASDAPGHLYLFVPGGNEPDWSSPQTHQPSSSPCLEPAQFMLLLEREVLPSLRDHRASPQLWQRCLTASTGWVSQPLCWWDASLSLESSDLGSMLHCHGFSHLTPHIPLVKWRIFKLYS